MKVDQLIRLARELGINDCVFPSRQDLLDKVIEKIKGLDAEIHFEPDPCFGSRCAFFWTEDMYKELEARMNNFAERISFLERRTSSIAGALMDVGKMIKP